MTLQPPREHVPLAPLTTIGLGGEARYFFRCENDETIRQGITFAAHHSLPLFVLGGGSNVLVPDEGFPGVVLHIATTGITVERMNEDITLAVAAGEQWDPFVAMTVRQNFAGLECLSGIPGSVGATPVQNVGAYGQEVASAIVEVHAFETRTLTSVVFRNDECLFGYRDSRFKRSDAGRFIITKVVFRLRKDGSPSMEYPELQTRVLSLLPTPSSKPTVNIVRHAVIQLRRSKAMVVDPAESDSRSVGSFFTNPVVDTAEAEALKQRFPDMPFYPSGSRAKLSAAWLVEHAGFHRGYAFGGAAVSGKHTLALVNKGTTTTELLALASQIQSKVSDIFRVTLEREPVIVRPVQPMHE
jgi:UDP-N-acetylmuramate dehydrogenase